MSAVRCPTCGARNTAGAAWCTQCYQPLDLPPEVERTASPSPSEPMDPPGPSEPPRSPPAPDASPGPRAGESAPVDAASAGAAEDRDVRARPEGSVEWRCGTCGDWSPLEAATCTTCGTARSGFGEPARPAPLRDDSATLLAASVALPGLAHLRSGRPGTALARALLAWGWLAAGVGLLVAAVRAGTGPWAALPPLAGAGAVWVLTYLDTRDLLAQRDGERLTGRVLLWLVAGVTGGLALALMFDAMRLAG